MESVKEQRVSVKFCFKIRTTAAETHDMMLEAYSDVASSQMMTYKCFICFKNRRPSTYDDEWSDRPSTSRFESLIAQVRTLPVETVD
jgi:hypothetical protein